MTQQINLPSFESQQDEVSIDQLEEAEITNEISMTENGWNQNNSTVEAFS